MLCMEAIGNRSCSYQRVKGRSHTVGKRKSIHPHKPHATDHVSQPSRNANCRIPSMKSCTSLLCTVDCRCFLSFVFVGGARRLELCPCVTRLCTCWAFLTAIPDGRMTLGNDMFVVSVWHRLGHHVCAHVSQSQG